MADAVKNHDQLPPGHNPQRRPIFKRRQASVVLSREQVAQIKLGRKKLRKELRDRGITSRKEFELTASALGLYFDKNRGLALLLWLFHGRGLWALLGAMLALMAALFMFSTVAQMQGHFTINLSDGLFREGFSLSDTVGFENPTMRLFAEPAVDVPCISLVDIREDVDHIDGLHSDATYFAYTFYIRNEGESTVDFSWQLSVNSESQQLSKALWVMLFEDGLMDIYAEGREDGSPEAIPYFDDDSRGYRITPLRDAARDPDLLYQPIKTTQTATYYRVVPTPYLTDELVTEGVQLSVAPMDVHKYTIVLWVEGDDPDCTNDLIGGHMGLDMSFELLDAQVEQEQSFWNKLWDNLTFWDND